MVRGGGLWFAASAVVLAVCSIIEQAKDGVTWYIRNAGDIFRWRDVWPQIADWFGLKAGLPLKACCSSQLGTC